MIKLGGSLAGSDVLTSWVRLVAEVAAGHGVIVPGGGPWADAVREAQQRDGFDDGVAHRRALRAMEAFGDEICRISRACEPADSPEGIAGVLAAGRVAVWKPFDMVVAEPSIPPSWDVTSDSLAAWLARRLDCPLLVLVKSIEHVDPELGVAEWSALGWVDSGFGSYGSSAGLRARMVGKHDYHRFAGLIAKDARTIPPSSRDGVASN